MIPSESFGLNHVQLTSSFEQERDLQFFEESDEIKTTANDVFETKEEDHLNAPEEVCISHQAEALQKSLFVQQSILQELEKNLPSNLGLPDILEPDQALKLAQYSMCCHGKISPQDAVKQLEGYPDGTALLRLSNSQPGFVLSYVQEGSVYHVYLEENTLECFDVKRLILPQDPSQSVMQSSFNISFEQALSLYSVYNHGTIQLEELSDLLKNYPKNTALVRMSTTKPDFVVTYISKDGEIRSRRLGWQNLEKVLRDLEVRVLILPENRSSVEKSSSKAETTIVDVQQQIEEEELNEKELITDYDRQVILNLGRGQTASGLNAKARAQGLPSATIDLRVKNGKLSELKELTHLSRLYIIGHCDAGLYYISSDEGIKVTVTSYVKVLERYAPQLKKPLAGHKIKISIVACYAGVDKGLKKSFAYRLSQALDRAGIPAEVIARTGAVSRWHGDPKEYKKLVEGQHQAENSKFTFTTENGITQIAPFVYSAAV